MSSKPKFEFSHNGYKNTFFHTIPVDYNTKEDKKPTVDKANKKTVDPAENQESKNVCLTCVYTEYIFCYHKLTFLTIKFSHSNQPRVS